MCHFSEGMGDDSCLFVGLVLVVVNAKLWVLLRWRCRRGSDEKRFNFLFAPLPGVRTDVVDRLDFWREENSQLETHHRVSKTLTIGSSSALTREEALAKTMADTRVAKDNFIFQQLRFLLGLGFVGSDGL